MPVYEIPPETTRELGRALSPLWLMTLRSDDVGASMERLGLEPSERYFPMRSAPLGRASLALVTATFFNFSPVAVGRSIPQVWDKVSPEQILAAQLEGVDVALRRAFAALDGQLIDEAASLMRAAAIGASERPEGRPLFAGYVSLPWPGEPHLDLWHAHYLLREFRGDGHIAVLTAEGLTGIEALALHIAMVPQIGPVFRTTRAWTDDEWDACVDRLRADGWITIADDGSITLTHDGAERRAGIESRTDELDVAGWAAIGREGTERVAALAPAITDALHAAGMGMPNLARPSST